MAIGKYVADFAVRFSCNGTPPPIPYPCLDYVVTSTNDLMYGVGRTLSDKALLLEVEGCSAKLLSESLIVIALCVPSTKVGFYLN
jgi:hypothetical protein